MLVLSVLIDTTNLFGHIPDIYFGLFELLFLVLTNLLTHTDFFSESLQLLFLLIDQLVNLTVEFFKRSLDIIDISSSCPKVNNRLICFINLGFETAQLFILDLAYRSSPALCPILSFCHLLSYIRQAN